jgi:hypothetical protein
MDHLNNVREALVAELIGDLAKLLDRVERVKPTMDNARTKMEQANRNLACQISDFEVRMSSTTETAKTRALTHIVNGVNEHARMVLDQQTQAMSDAAQVAFHREVGATMGSLVSSLRGLVERVDRPWELWLTHAATAATSALCGGGLVAYILHR